MTALPLATIHAWPWTAHLEVRGLGAVATFQRAPSHGQPLVCEVDEHPPSGAGQDWLAAALARVQARAEAEDARRERRAGRVRLAAGVGDLDAAYAPLPSLADEVP